MQTSMLYIRVYDAVKRSHRDETPSLYLQKYLTQLYYNNHNNIFIYVYFSKTCLETTMITMITFNANVSFTPSAIVHYRKFPKDSEL